MVFDAYKAEWQRTHDIENKASNTIGFVGVIFSLTVVTLSTVLVYTDEITRTKIFFSSIYSPIGIFLILLFMILSIFFGIMALSVKEWSFPLAEDFLDHCKAQERAEVQLLEDIFSDYVRNINNNDELNDKIALYLRVSHISFLLSVIIVTIYFFFIIDAFN
ncbi:hypothetical protein [Methanohalophilus euhalobius]|jgi:magnesium-transporting ATPase (P-type)|uniref:Uncharacterized protein n=1 Tax=Methanohalophilus euhalobius TaxID=51203 RepID=A0A314ZNU2_9EURY|nr:hypothetical protein [Methanohalophilus euhalobius]PQV42722.1 hypothetical protein B0H22_105189 [Methanohalophilus euhalobius]RNI08741.1 hypothetical protein EDD83_06605 [Methanohalophilus euhalobius]